VARRNILDKQLLPFPTEFKFAFEADQVTWIGKSINQVISALEVQWLWDERTNTGLCLAAENVWSRSARRKRRKLEIEDVASMTNHKEGEVKLGVTVTVSIGTNTVEVRWLKGYDAVLYESFCGMLKRSINTRRQET